MRIIVSATLGGGSAGTWYATETARRLGERGHEIWYLSRRGRSALERARKSGLTTIDDIDLEDKSLPKIFSNLRRLAEHARTLNPDIVLAHGAEDHAMWVLLRATRRLKYALIRVRALDPKPPKRHMLSRWLHRRTDMIVCANSRHLASYNQRLGIPFEKLRIIEAGINPDDFRALGDDAMAANQLAFPKDKPVVVMVARFAPIKGYRMLLSAVGMLKKRGIDCHTIWVGYPKEYTRPMLARWLVEANLQSDITIIDRLLPDLPALLSRCQVGVIASVGSETVSRSLLEYFACGLPVVATDVGGIPDLMGRGEFGRLVPAENANALADAIADLLADEPRRIAMGQCARDYVFAHCTWDQRVDRWESVLQAVVKSASSP